MPTPIENPLQATYEPDGSAAAATDIDAPVVPSRWRALLRASIAPLAVSLFGIAPFLLLPHLDGDDRALVWVEADAAVRGRVEAGITAEPAFVGGLRDDAEARPPECTADAIRLHLDFRRTDEAQIAREALERIAVDAGARICATQRFELGRRDDSVAWGALVASLALPLGVLLLLRGTPHSTPRQPARITPATSSVALAAGLLATTFSPTVAADAGAGAVLAGFAFATLSPVIHEAAFRGWMIPHLQPAFGHVGSGLLSIAASAAAGSFGGVTGASSAALVATAGAVVYLGTRSLAACIAAHMLMAALARVITA